MHEIQERVRVPKREELQHDPEWRGIVQDALAQLSDQEKIDIVTQSFMVGAGSIEAHNYYILYLGHQLNLSPTQSSELLRQCFLTASEEAQRKITQAAYHRHVDEMKKSVRQKQKEFRRSSLENLSPAQSVHEVILSQFPEILNDSAFSKVDPKVIERIQTLPRDFSPGLDSPVVKTLREISTELGAYDDRKWYQKQQAELQQKTK
jgi:hypothetical protein